MCVDGAVVSHNLQWGSCHREEERGKPIITASYSTTHLFGSSADLETNCCCNQFDISDMQRDDASNIQNPYMIESHLSVHMCINTGRLESQYTSHSGEITFTCFSLA